MTRQRYVAEELTHFVGRSLSEDREQYQLLLHILKSRRLKCDPEDRFFWVEEGHEGGRTYVLNMVHFLDEDVYQPAYQPLANCFCDIPLADLELHMQKYSRFGLSFLKPFLVAQGANPVFYIAKNSAAMSSLDGTRETYFKRELERYQELYSKLSDLMHRESKLHEAMYLHKFLGYNVFGFMKVFDDAAAETDYNNFYMEREWRVLGDVNFALEDVYRVILPELYISRRHEDLPGYRGQIYSAPNTPD